MGEGGRLRFLKIISVKHSTQTIFDNITYEGEFSEKDISTIEEYVSLISYNAETHCIKVKVTISFWESWYSFEEIQLEQANGDWNRD